MANDIFGGLMDGLATGAGLWGQNYLNTKAEERAAKRQAALNVQEAQLKAQAEEAALRLKNRFSLPSYETVEVDGPDGRKLKRTIKQSFDPNTGAPMSETIGESALPLEAPKMREIMSGGQKVNQEFDPKTGQWKEVGRGAAFAPQQPRAPSELEARINEARKLGATDDQLRALALGASANGGDKAPAGYRQTSDGSALEPIPGGPADEGRKARELSGEAKQKLGLIDNALRNAEEYRKRVVTKDGKGFNDMGSFTSNTPGLLQSAIQDMLYVKSGASAPVEEVRKWESIYGPSRMAGIPLETDETAAKKVEQLITDIKSLRNEYDPKGIYGAAVKKPADSEPPKPAAAVTGKPDPKQWVEAARKANPGASDAELVAYYKQKYGG